jgi:hypothetical protein
MFSFLFFSHGIQASQDKESCSYNNYYYGDSCANDSA